MSVGEVYCVRRLLTIFVISAGCHAILRKNGGNRLQTEILTYTGGSPCAEVSRHRMFENKEEQVRQRLFELETEHGDLDSVIKVLTESTYVDQIQMQRFKRRKLHIKDTISKLRSELIPDLDA